MPTGMERGHGSLTELRLLAVQEGVRLLIAKARVRKQNERPAQAAEGLVAILGAGQLVGGNDERSLAAHGKKASVAQHGAHIAQPAVEELSSLGKAQMVRKVTSHNAIIETNFVFA